MLIIFLLLSTLSKMLTKATFVYISIILEKVLARDLYYFCEKDKKRNAALAR